jgi:thiol-disulfide isomerase/thioredoxin
MISSRSVQARPSVIAATLIAVCLFLTPATQAAEESMAGQASPALELENLAGNAQSLDQFRGRIVILNFWATWCIPCREEMPILVQLKKEFRDRGVEIVGASADASDAVESVRNFSRDYGLNFPIWIGATIPDMLRFGLGDELPATVIIDSDGQIAYRILGPLTRKDLITRLSALLGDQTDSPPDPVMNTFHIDAQNNSSPKGISAEAAGQRGADETGDKAEESHDHETQAGESHAHGGVGKDASLVPS